MAAAVRLTTNALESRWCGDTVVEPDCLKVHPTAEARHCRADGRALQRGTRVTLSTKAAPKDVSAPELLRNREISRLDFNQRVLDQATSGHHPLLERVKFLAIVGANLDEFFMVRVATFLKTQRAGLEDVGPDGLSISQRLTAIRQRAKTMLYDQAACWHDALRPALAA